MNIKRKVMLSALFVLGLLAALSVGSMVLADGGCDDPPPPCDDCCARSPGFYKKADHWKDADGFEITKVEIGGIEYKRDGDLGAIYWLKSPVRGDKTITLFKALVAAKLNVVRGCEDNCIAETIAAADEWMKLHPVGDPGVEASSDAWQGGCDEECGECLYWLLDAYNNGKLCAPGCD